MAEEKGSCRYHSEEVHILCKFTGRQCFGSYFDEFEQKYVVDLWKEQECPQYKHGEASVFESSSSFDLKEAFEEQRRASLDQSKVEIVLFGSVEPAECEDGSCEVPETIDVDSEVLQHYFNRKYGEGEIKVGWVDVLSPELEDYPEVSEYIARHESYPIVTVNGVIKFVGSISVDLLKEELSKLGLVELK